ncbi:ankyrin [Daldinia loculata]|uniref:ankyrin n=1 Tax=Daldinia loculata TaxID=103429 RepID=UPI0020C3730E|nr:ankyrin [Daldinia loculata]KAI1650596.1 ankyrin [Daldinia loculata]
MAALDQLPAEISHMIAGFLTIRTETGDIVADQKALASLTRVNTRLRDAFDPILWKTNAVFSAPDGPDGRRYPRSAVHWAATKNRIDILEKAYKYNLALGIACNGAPLNSAARLGQDAAVCWLLDHGVPTDPRTSGEISSGHHSNARKAVPYFHSPLYTAIKMRQESTALTLLSRGANMWFRRRDAPEDKFREAAIHSAAFYGLPAVVKHLVLTMGIDVDELDRKLETPLNHAMRQSDNEKATNMIKTLLELGADIHKEQDSELPLTTAIQCRNFSSAMLFLDARPRVNLSNTGPGSMSPLAECALWVGEDHVFLSDEDDKVILSEQRQLFQKLIMRGADVDAPCNGLDTPLGIAIRRGTNTAVHELIIGGADIEKCTGGRQLKPIDLIWDIEDTIDIAIKGATLVAAGARLDVPSKADSKTSLERAVSYNRYDGIEGQPILSALLCSAGRQSFRTGYLDELFQYCLEQRLYEPAKILMRHGASSQGAKKAAYDWAHEIICSPPDDCSQRILSFCLDFQFSNDEIENLFTEALNSEGEEYCHFLMDRGLLSFSKEPRPWLHLAVKYDNFSLTRRLCRAGMDINALDISSETPMMVALEAEHYAIVDLLFDLGADPFHPRPDVECRRSQDWYYFRKIISPFEYAVRRPRYHELARRWWRDSPLEFITQEDLYTPRVLTTNDYCERFIDRLRQYTRSGSKDTERPTSRPTMRNAEEQIRFKEKISIAREEVWVTCRDTLEDDILKEDWGWTED